MKVLTLKNTVIASVIGLFGVFGSVSAQNVRDEYRDCQRAQARMQREYNDYAASGGRRNYRDWMRAQGQAYQQCSEYQQAVRNTYYNRNDRYNDNYYGRYNDTYNNRYNGRTVYDNRSGQYYRVMRNGSYYETNQRGVELLRQAVNQGYQQGYRQGQIDRRYGRGGSYYGSSVYNEGTYGYQSYVDRDQYQYYFQQGFQRGYQDGYNTQSRYGYRTNNSMNILGTILNGILQISR